MVIKRSRTMRITRRTGFVFESKLVGAGAGGSGRLSRNRFGRRYSRRGRPLRVNEGGGGGASLTCAISAARSPGTRFGRVESTSIVHSESCVVDISESAA
jgi:hypothetical protein